MISQARMEKALIFLAETDEKAAELQANMERMDYKAHAVKDALIKHGEGGLGDRTASAGCDQTYLDAMEDYFKAIAAYNAVRNKRRTEELVIDVFRTMEASRRKA